MRLKDKTAIVVGAGQTPGTTIGNGRAMAILFSREGADVLCVDRDGVRAEETVAMILKEGGRAAALEANITKPDAGAAIIAAAKARFGRIDILVNNVGIGGRDGPAHKVEEADFDRTMSVNLKGIRSVASSATLIELIADPTATNSMAEPTSVIPVTRQVGGVALSFNHTFPPYSISVLRLSAK